MQVIVGFVIAEVLRRLELEFGLGWGWCWTKAKARVRARARVTDPDPLALVREQCERITVAVDMAQLVKIHSALEVKSKRAL